MKRYTALAALALVVAACGTDSDGEVATLEDTTDTTVISAEQQEVDAEEAILGFAQCMRDNGVPDFPDPVLDTNGNFGLFGGEGPGGAVGELGDRETLEAAFEECGDLVEGVIQNTLRDIDITELQDSFLEFAACMREHDIEIDDPDFSGGFGPGAGGGRGLFGDLDFEDPAVQEAIEECSEIFEGRLPGPGGGRPGGPGQ
jgi:hypothetical protein